MKKTIFYSLFSALFMLTSCSMFEIDNYEEPAETIWGEVVDEATGKRVLTDQGSEGIRPLFSVNATHYIYHKYPQSAHPGDRSKGQGS